MLRGVAQLKRFIAAEKVHPWHQENQLVCYFLCNSRALFSSSPKRKSSSLHNYYIRKRRKWPIQSYKTQWLENLAFQLAKQSFKQSIKKSKSHLLNDLINSFAAYEIEPTPQSYHFLFKILIRSSPSNCHDQISQVLDHIERVESFETPECIFVDLIKFYGGRNMFHDAVELFFRMPRFRCDPSVEVLNALLLILCESEKGLEIVPRILVKSQGMSIRIEESSFEILIRALCRIGRASNALELLHHMVEEGFDVDQKVCSLMLGTMCRQLICDGGEIMRFLDDLKSLGFDPRKHDFFNVISVLVRRGEGMDALKLLKQMKMNGVKPDIMCYNVVLDGLISNREFSNADKVFDELLVLGLVPDISTYNAYINGLCMQEKVEDGIIIMGSMEELGCAPDSSTYNTILRALFDAGKLERVREVVDKMQQKCMHLNQHTYEILIDGFVNNGDTDGACTLLNEMLDKNLVPQTASLDKLVRWICKSGLSVKTEELLETVLNANSGRCSRASEEFVTGLV